MRGHQNFLLAGLTLAFQLSYAGDLYVTQKDVTKSRYYTGATGTATVQPLDSQTWLAEHASDSADLAIRDYGFLIEDAQLYELIYGIANKLLAPWPGDAPAFAIFVQGDRSPLVYGAATTYTKEIFISYGVFIHAESEDELAAVIGHELAHVLLEHGKALEYKKNMEKSLETLGSARDLYSTAEALRYNEATKELTVDSSVDEDLQKSAAQKVVADKLYTSVHASLFSRGNESDADKLALDLMVAAGYSPMGLKASLERMAHSYDLSTEISTYFESSSQTLLQESLVVLDDYMGEKEIQSQELDQFMEDSKDEFTDSALDFGKTALLSFTSRSHPVPDKRVQKITAYLYDNYPRSVRRRKENQAADDIYGSEHLAAILNHYSRANQALELLGHGDMDAADYYSHQAIESPTASDSYTRYSAFFVSRSRGYGSAAIANLDAIDPQSLMPVFATLEIADYLADAERTQEAISMMEKYEGYYGTIEGYYPPKIKVSKAASNNEEVTRLTLECYNAVPAASPLAKSCAQAAGVSPPQEANNTAANKPDKILKSLFKPR